MAGAGAASAWPATAPPRGPSGPASTPRAPERPAGAANPPERPEDLGGVSPPLAGDPRGHQLPERRLRAGPAARLDRRPAAPSVPGVEQAERVQPGRLVTEPPR